jgi:hypothetical protein
VPIQTPSIATNQFRLSRRTLLRAATSTAAGLAISPWLSRTAAFDDATPVATVGESAWSDLARRLSGRLLRPGDAMYPAATAINAARYAGTRPQAIAVCLSPQDAAACLT